MRALLLGMWVCVAVAFAARRLVRMNTRRLGRLGFISLVVAIATFGSMKPDTIGQVMDFVGGLFGSGSVSSVAVEEGGEAEVDPEDWDGDGIPNEFEDRVFMDKTNALDAVSHRYDLGMTALEKYEVSADWRVVDTAGDGISDAWKLRYGLVPVSQDIGTLTATNGMTFWECFLRGANPLVKTTNPANLPLTDLQVVELGYSPLEAMPHSATNRVAGDVTIVALSMSGPGAGYAQVRIGPVVHAGRGTRQYVLRSGQVFNVVVERLPGLTGGAGLAVAVSVNPVEGIVAELPGFTGQFEVPAAAGGFMPMSAGVGGGGQRIETWRVALGAERGGCIHGTCGVTATVTSVLTDAVVRSAGELSWSWVAGTPYGVLPGKSSRRDITVGLDETARENWEAYKATLAAGSIRARARQPLKCEFEILYADAFIPRISGRASAELGMGCCLAYKDQPGDNTPHVCTPDCEHCKCDNVECKCTGCGSCDKWAGCPSCQTYGGTITTNTTTGAGIPVTGLRLNNNWDLGGMNGTAPREDRDASKFMLPGQTSPDPDLLPLGLMSAPEADCCVCVEHGPDWQGKILTIAEGLNLLDGYLQKISNGQNYYTQNPPPALFHLEGAEPGGWDGSKYVVWSQGRLGGEMTPVTNRYVVGRDLWWGHFLLDQPVLSDANRLQCPQGRAIQLITSTSATTNTVSVGMGIWAGSHPKGYATMSLIGDGHFELWSTSGARLLTNGQSRAWNATVDGMNEYHVRSFSPGKATLRVSYTNAVTTGIEFRAVLPLESFTLPIKPDMNTNGVINTVDESLLAKNRAAKTPVDVLYYATNGVFNLIHLDTANAPTNGQQQVVIQGEPGAFRLYTATNQPPVAVSSLQGTAYTVTQHSTTNTTPLWIECLRPSLGAVHHVYSNTPAAIRAGTNTLTIAADEVIAGPVTYFPGNPAGLTPGDIGRYSLRLKTFHHLFKDHITWSNLTHHVAFDGANTGSNITVRANAVDNSGLTARIMNLQLPTLFHIAVTNLVDINMTVFIVSNNVTAAWTPTEVNNFAVGANEYLRPAGVRLVVASIQYTNNPTWYDMANTGVGFNDMAIIPIPARHLRVFFVKSVVGATGFNSQYRMVISKSARYNTVAHETLHACGLPDIYVDKGGRNIFGDGVVKSSYLHAKDWGAGFYDETLQHADLVKRLLMYGNTDPDKGYIPHGKVRGVYNTQIWNPAVDDWFTDVDYVEIGLDKINRHPQHDTLRP